MTNSWGLAEQPTVAKLNAKTILQDTGANIAAAAAYNGQVAYCTSTGSGFTAGTYYYYNGSAWNPMNIGLRPLGIISYIDIVPKMWQYELGGNGPGPSPGFSGTGGSQGVLLPSVAGGASSLTEPLALSGLNIDRPVVEFSKISNLLHAYFEIWVGTYSGSGGNDALANGDTINVDLYDVTHSATISGTALNATSSNTQYVKILSGDIAANLPSSDSTLTVRIYDSTNTSYTPVVGMARLKLMW